MTPAVRTGSSRGTSEVDGSPTASHPGAAAAVAVDTCPASGALVSTPAGPRLGSAFSVTAEGREGGEKALGGLPRRLGGGRASGLLESVGAGADGFSGSTGTPTTRELRRMAAAGSTQGPAPICRASPRSLSDSDCAPCDPEQEGNRNNQEWTPQRTATISPVQDDMGRERDARHRTRRGPLAA